MGGAKVKKVMTQAINLIFEFLKNVRPCSFCQLVLLFFNCNNIIRKREFKYGCMKIPH